MASSNRIPRELNDSIQNVLNKNLKISLSFPVRMETKGDKLENKVLVFTAFRIFVMAAKIPSKVDTQFHYLELQAIESKKQHQLCLQAADKSYAFHSLDNNTTDVDAIIFHIETILRNIFPAVPLDDIVRKVDVIPATRIQSLYENNQSSLKKDVGPCGGFSKQYACLCDFHGLPFREEVAWDVDTIYLAHDTKEICLHDFDHLDARDLVPILSALEYNTWFTKLRASNTKLSLEAFEQVFNVMKKNSYIEELYLDNTGLKWELAHKLSIALLSNSKIPLHTVDLSNNLIEDKGANHISKAASKTSKGIIHLNLAKTGLTSKGVNTLIHALSVNKFMPNTLTYLNLADNNLKEEVNNLYNFLAQPNSLTHLDLSGTECSFDMLFGALLRGCCQKLSHINLSRNTFTHKKTKDPIVPPSFKQFFLTTIGLKYFNISMTKIPLEALKNMLLGLSCNESATDVELDLSNNGLGSQGAHVLEMCLPEMKCLTSLDLTENGLENELGSVISSLSKNKAIRRLCIGKNFMTAKTKKVSQAMEALVQMIQEEDCGMEYLSLADSRLKADIYNLINALGSNQCLVTIDISGNQMGDIGARLLAKALQINNRLRALVYDRNCVTAQGFHDLAYAMESNYSVRYMPFPLHDAVIAMKSAPERTEAALRKIESLVHRNVSPKKFSNGQAFRLQQGFLFSSTQQVVDKLVVQTQDTVNLLKQATGDIYKENLEKANGFIQDANNSKQLLTRFQDVVLQREESGNSVEQKLSSVSQELTAVVEAHLQGTVAGMMKACEEQCPNIMSIDKVKESLQHSCHEKSVLPKNFMKHCIVEMAGTDILNKMYEIHLAVASHLSDHIVDHVVESLTNTYKTLLSLSHKRHSVVSDTNRNRNRTDSSSSKGDSICDGTESSGSPRATPQLSGKRRTVHSRKLRPQSVVDDDYLCSLPGSNQKLEHLVKDRPKRLKAHAVSRPAVKSTEIITDQNLSDGMEHFFQHTSVSMSNIVLESNGKSLGGLPQMDSVGVEDRNSKESLAGSEKRMSTDSDNDKRNSFKDKNSKTFMKELNNVFARPMVPDRTHHTKSVEQSEHTTEESTTVLISEVEVKSKQIESGARSPLAEGVVQRHPGISKMGVSDDILAEIKAKQEKRLSASQAKSERISVMSKTVKTTSQTSFGHHQKSSETCSKIVTKKGGHLNPSHEIKPESKPEVRMRITSSTISHERRPRSTILSMCSLMQGSEIGASSAPPSASQNTITNSLDGVEHRLDVANSEAAEVVSSVAEGLKDSTSVDPPVSSLPQGLTLKGSMSLLIETEL